MRLIVVLLLVIVIGAIAYGLGRGRGEEGRERLDRLKDDLKQTGEDLKDAAHSAGTQVRPMYEDAKEHARRAVHDAAEKVADKTETQPAR